ncbi:hypothetical protein [Catenulispora pinisilvae]|uniref:hypothetical protein n=1 Tax=Catenulispora pinisilvae TaxID=2705253 RepID=UPI001891F3F7|nr:hypothetical protein [Catenulispora pinisilvae]
MPLIVLASDKGAPGVTTTAVTLAGVWPRRAILAECDPSGGDLVYRTPAENGSPLNPNIGMLSLATTARHGLSAHQLEQHLQRMQGGLEVITGLATGDQSTGLTGLWPALGRAFATLPDADVIADCGRVEGASPVLDLMAAASAVVLVARASAEQIAHVRDRALSLMQRVGPGTGLGLGVPIGVVLIVDPKQRARVTAQVDELLRNSGLPVRVIGTLATDPDGADLINGRGRGRLDRTLLIRSAREVALDLYRRFTMSQGSGMPQTEPAPPRQYSAQPMPPQQGPAHPMPAQPVQQGPAQQPPAPGMPASSPAPAVGYPPSAPNQPPPPAPGTPKQPMFRRDAPAQPAWPGEPPSAPRGSGHEGFGPVTVDGAANPNPGPPAPQPQYPEERRGGTGYDRLPPRGDIDPGSSSHRAGPPQGS